MDQVSGRPDGSSEDDLSARVAYAHRAWTRLSMRLRSVTPSTVARAMLVVIGLWLLGWLVARSWSVLAPFMVGLAIAYLLLPLVDFLEWQLPRWAAILVVYGMLCLTLFGAWEYIVPPLVNQIAALVSDLPGALQSQLPGLLASLQKIYKALPRDTQQQISGLLESASSMVRDNLLSSLQGLLHLIVGGIFTVYSVLSFALGLVIVPFFIYYVLRDYAKIPLAVDAMLPGWLRADFWAVVQIADQNVSRYLRGQAVLALFGAAATFLALNILTLVGFRGVDYTLLLAIFSGLTVLIPYVGFVLAVLAAFGVGAFSSWETAIAMAVLVFIIKQIIDSLIYPVIVGRSVHLNAAIILVVLVILSEFGVIWVILAPPVAAAARDLFLYIYGRLGDPPRSAGVLPHEDATLLPLPEGQGQPLPGHPLS